MFLTADTPLMSHSPVYYHDRPKVSTTPFGSYGASLSHVQRPASAHLYQQHHNLSPVMAGPASQRSSESGRHPKPAGVVNPKLDIVRNNLPRSTSPHPFSFLSDAERGLMDHDLNRSSKPHSGRYGTGPSQIASRPDGSLAEYSTTIYTYTPESGGVDKIADHAVLVLLWLACLDPFYSLFSAMYTIFAVLALFILTPFRLCDSASSFKVLSIRTLAPLFRLHLRLMHAESAQGADELELDAKRLIAVQVLSPLLSTGVAIAEWIAAPFWIFAIIMGNPDGTERRDDGRATVLAVRNLWKKCLLKAAVR